MRNEKLNKLAQTRQLSTFKFKFIYPTQFYIFVNTTKP